MKNDDIQAFIKEIRCKMESERIASKVEVCEILTEIIRADITECINEDGTIKFERLNNGMAVSDYEYKDLTGGRKHIKLKLHDRKSAINLLSELKGWKDQMETPPAVIQVVSNVNMDMNQYRKTAEELQVKDEGTKEDDDGSTD